MAPRSSTTFEPGWLSGKTRVLRIPEALAEAVLQHARWLDRELHSGGGSIGPSVEDARRPVLDAERPVNVASVTQVSPFRYPGGKTWLVPYLRVWTKSLSTKPSLFIEPFAGGATAGLTAALESWADHVIIADADEAVAAVWRTILSSQSEWLAREILGFQLTLNNVKSALAEDTGNGSLPLRRKAFLTVLRNRVQRGGILAPGAGLVKQGENNKGIASRWYPKTLARRIRSIAGIRHRITFCTEDAFRLIAAYSEDEDAVFYVDPPYTKAARRLYTHWQVDHQRLFAAMADARGEFLMSYDNTPEIRELAERFGLKFQTVAMKNTHHAKMKELLISRNPSWLAGSATPRSPISS